VIFIILKGVSDMSSITKRSDLFRQYARVIDMCEGTNVNALDCIKFNDRPLVERNKSNEPEFILDPSCYDFAIAILEGKPLFAGDTVYCITKGSAMIISAYGPPVKEFIDQVTWNKPARKIKIDSVELPRPLDDESPHQVGVCGTSYYFRSIDDSREFMNGVIELINRAMNETKKV